MTKYLAPMTLAVASVCIQAEAADAADRNPLDAHAIVDVGWFFVSADTRVRVDGETIDRTGTDVDFDETFGLDDVDRFRAEVLWRIGERHAIRGMYFQNNRRATSNLARDINYGDETFPLGASVTARSELTVAQLAYDYAFRRRDGYELAGSIGVHMLDVGLSLDATPTSESDSVSGTLGENATTTAPLPVVGLRGIWRLPHNLYLTAQAQYFYIKFDPYSGSLTDLKATLVWQMTDHVGLGVGYNDFGFRFDLDDEGEFSGRLRWDYGGAFAFASFMF